MSASPFDPPLVLVTDRRRFPEAQPAGSFAAGEWRVLEAAVRAGVGAVQLREKDLDGGASWERATRLVALCGAGGPRVLVNDRADVARAAGAHGVHLPGSGLSVDAARAVVGRGLLVGRSIHDRAELAEARGADYVVFGPVFDTPSKRPYGAPQGLAALRAVVAASSVPVFAIGGIVPERVRDVLAHGATGVAVMGAILAASDPAEVVRSFREELARR